MPPETDAVKVTPMHQCPRMTNTYMLGGGSYPNDILADLKDGIYAVGFGGGQVDITNGKFVFSCTEAYSVKNGKIGSPVKGVTLIGDGATALKQIKGIGNDMALDPGMGNCGKAGQWGACRCGPANINDQWIDSLAGLPNQKWLSLF